MSDRFESLSLLTDLYQLTMANGYWAERRAGQEAVFHLFFRRNPFNGGYAICAGLQSVLDFLRTFQFDTGDIDYLRTIAGNDGQTLFDAKFLQYLADLNLSVDVDAVPEGTVVFPHEPLIRIRGPIIQCQLLETALLNIVNFQTLIATKASRVVAAAQGDPVLEFGLRRAQGVDGALAASRAAFIGGCAATSNVLAGKRFGIPVKGTHAHSWVMSFDSEPEAFAAYAQAMPNNCVFLVDTYDTLQGVRHAIVAGQRLGEKGHRMVGIRLDSGDLEWLSKEARKLLDSAGFEEASIVASNDLDEYLVQSLKSQGAAINVWGVGTKLVTAHDQPALGGVYKLGAIRNAANQWEPKIKISEQLIKTSTPGVQQIRRYFTSDDTACADMIFSEHLAPAKRSAIVAMDEATNRTEVTDQMTHEDLLVPVMRNGQIVFNPPEITLVRERTFRQLDLFPDKIKQFDNPHRYCVGLEEQLHDLKQAMMNDAKMNNANQSGVAKGER